MEYPEEVWNQDASQNDRGDDPGSESLDDPVNLPGPATNSTEGNEIGSGGEASNPVINDAYKRIWSQTVLAASILAGLLAEPWYLTKIALGNRISIELIL